jgi:hypothetical protein
MPVVESVNADFDGNGKPYTVQGWNDGGTTVIRDGHTFMKTNGAVPITGSFSWKRGPQDRFLAVDVDGDGKQEILIYNDDDEWTGVLKWREALHTIWGSPSPLHGPAGDWTRGWGDRFTATQADGHTAVQVASVEGAEGTLRWQNGALALTGVVPSDAITLPERRADLGGGHVMVTSAELSHRLHVASFVEHITCTNKIEGFTGGVQLLFYDEEENFTGQSDVQQNGIGQAPLIGAGHRTITWSGLAPQDAVWLVLAQFHDPHNRAGWLGEAAMAITGFFHDVGVFLKGKPDAAEKQLAKQHPDLVGKVDVVGRFRTGEHVFLTVKG